MNPPDMDRLCGSVPYSIAEVIHIRRQYHNVLTVTCISQNVDALLEKCIYRRLDCAIRIFATQNALLTTDCNPDAWRYLFTVF